MTRDYLDSKHARGAGSQVTRIHGQITFYKDTNLITVREGEFFRGSFYFRRTSFSSLVRVVGNSSFFGNAADALAP